MDRYQIGSMFVYIDFNTATPHNFTPVYCLLATIKYLVEYSTSNGYSMKEIMTDYIKLLTKFMKHPLDTGDCEISSTEMFHYLECSTKSGLILYNDLFDF